MKRKMEDGEEAPEMTRRKQGRPQTTGLYVGQAEAMDICIKKEKELAKLQEEKLLREMSPGQLFSKLERDLEKAIEELENAPTADIANQAREFMAQVVRVAKGSKNLQSKYVRLLKQAAVMGAATTEILRTRADRGESDSEISRLLKVTRKELADVRREATSTREELDSLRKELAEEREKGKRMSRRRAVIDDSPPPSPERTVWRKAPETGDADEPPPPDMEEVSPMEIEMASEGPPPLEERVYDDAKRKRELLPPGEKLPPAIRPAIRGVAKILDDRPLTGRTVLLGRMPTVDIRGSYKKEERPPHRPAPRRRRKGEPSCCWNNSPLS